MNYNEKLKELTEKFILEMESLKSKNQLLKIEKEKDSARYEETFKLSEDKHNQVKRPKMDGLKESKWAVLEAPSRAKVHGLEPNPAVIRIKVDGH